MKIAAVALHRYRLPLCADWRTAGGGFAWREGWLLRLDAAGGARAYGDCAPLPMSGTETLAAAEPALQALARRLVGKSASDALATLDRRSACRTPAARCAVETALLDLLAQASGCSLAACLHDGWASADPPPKRSTVAVNAALGSVGEVSETAILEACREGFQVLKLKVGIAGVRREIDHLWRLADLLPKGIWLRLDANRAWRFSDASRFLQSCVGLPVEMLEEPLAKARLDRLQSLQAGTPLAIAVDESTAFLDLERLLRRCSVRRLVIKPARAGGLLAARALARRATRAGLECVVTSNLDSACGVLAAAHLAAAIDNHLAHGLATSTWLKRDTGPRPAIAHGRLWLPDTPGLGFVPGSEIVFAPLDLC
ncbi:o-succinylbenzoate synthase [Accumulibacter sp.]|uniref:o-succinylbenzoate synthase n=1 Tax=Accumulibacter sp. TaxID=2053492 RepID=UPI00262183A7|nr:o-succinylbenzoate synthase [Accumulibacter sp.]